MFVFCQKKDEPDLSSSWPFCLRCKGSNFFYNIEKFINKMAVVNIFFKNNKKKGL